MAKKQERSRKKGTKKKSGLLSNLIFLFLMVWVAYYILHKYLTKAVEYTRLLPVWKYLAAIPVLFFIMFRLASRSLAPARMLRHHPDMIFFAVCWFACIYTVHYVSLRILSRLSESYAAKEQYRTTRLLASVQKSQMATLQYNLEQFKKARHDYRHHLITLKGLLEQKESEFAGAIYSEMQNATDYSDPVTVLYGHNMNNGSMFKTLHSFEKPDFFKKNKYIYIYMPSQKLTFKIYAAYVYDNRHILNSFDFSNKSVLEKYQKYTLNPDSMNKNTRKVTLNKDSKILTLSTCTNGAENTRYLVQGVLIKREQTN